MTFDHTIVDILEKRALREPNRLAFIFLPDGEQREERLTYGELAVSARSIAARLRQTLNPGERAALLFPSGLEFIKALFGCFYADVGAIPLNVPGRHPAEAKKVLTILAHSKPKAVLTQASIAAPLSDMFLKGSPAPLPPLWVIDEPPLEEGELKDFSPPALGDLALLQYTSGSTSDPKGVLVTHENLMWNQKMIQEVVGTTPDTVGVSWLPLFHDLGLIAKVIQPIYAGCHTVIFPPIRFMERPSRWLHTIHRYRGTASGAPNFAYEYCARKIKPEELNGLDLRSWTFAFSGAEPVRWQTIQRFSKTFAPFGFNPSTLHPSYGLAEATLLVSGKSRLGRPSFLSIDSSAIQQNRVMLSERRPPATVDIVGCGLIAEGEVVRIIDPQTSQPCPPDQIGEIWVSSGSVASGYWKNDEETRKVFGNELSDEPQRTFLRTGDLGFLHEGEIYVTGRIKDLIIINGQNFYPQDIELAVQTSHPALRPGDGAAFSVTDDLEERLVVVQAIDKANPLEMDGILRSITESVVGIHGVRPWRIVLVPPGSVPKTTSGKIQRNQCKRHFLDEKLQPIAQTPS